MKNVYILIDFLVHNYRTVGKGLPSVPTLIASNLKTQEVRDRMSLVYVFSYIEAYVHSMTVHYLWYMYCK